MNDQLIGVIFNIIAAIVVFVVGLWANHKYRHKARTKLAEWLRKNNLNTEAVTKAVVHADKVLGSTDKFVCRFFVKTEKTGEQQVSEQILTLDEMKKELPSLAIQMKDADHSEINFLEHVQ
jgi:FtsZ-interacting cell division protein ZipA